MTLSVLVWIRYLVRLALAYMPVWLWSVIATIFSGIFLSVLFSRKKIKGITKIIFAIVILAIFVGSTLAVHRIRGAEQEKLITTLIDEIDRRTILLDRRVRVGENPYFISGDFVDDRPVIEILPYRGLNKTLIRIDDITLTLEKPQEKITIAIEGFNREFSQAFLKKNLIPGYYLANLPANTFSFIGIENRGFEWKPQGQSKYQTEFIVAEQFDIKDFSVSMKPTRISGPGKKFFPWGLTVSYLFTKSPSSVEMRVYNARRELISTVNDLPRYAGYNEYFWSYPYPYRPLYSGLYYEFELEAKKDEKEISKTTLYMPILEFAISEFIKKRK